MGSEREVSFELPGEVSSLVQHHLALLVMSQLQLRIKTSVHPIHPLLLLFPLTPLPRPLPLPLLLLPLLLLILILLHIPNPLHPPELVDLPIRRVLNDPSSVLKTCRRHIDVHPIEETFYDEDLTAAVHVPSLVETVVRLP